MSQFRAWFGDEPEYKNFSSLATAIKFIKKILKDYDEEECGLDAFLHGEWDEWLDEDDQNIHEHLYMIASEPSAFDEDEDDDLEDDDLEDEDDLEEDEDDLEEPFEDDFDEEDRLINAISGNMSTGTTTEEVFSDEDEDEDEDDLDDEDDLEDED